MEQLIHLITSNPEITSALVALLGVYLSIRISTRQSKRQVETDLRRVKQEFKKTYTTPLLEERLKRYPDLYKIIVLYFRTIRREGIKIENLEQLNESIISWDVENSLLLSSKSRQVVLDVYKIVRSAIKEKKANPDFSSKRDIIELLSKLELNLKSDLGIFLVEFPEVTTGYFDSYMDLTKANTNHEAPIEIGETEKAEPE